MSASYGTRTSVQSAWLVGAACLVVILFAGGGWLVWRGVGGRPASLADSTTSGPSSLAVENEVAFGAPAVVDGVPWRFPLTEQGAAAAASTAVATTGQADAVFDPDRFDEVAAVVFTDDQAVAQARQVDAARSEFEVSGWAAQPASRRLYFFVPLAARLVEWDADGPEAMVEVWAISLVGVGDAGGAVFTTSTVTLEPAADAHTWTVSGLDTEPGPTPMVHEVASAPGRTRLWLRDAVPTWPLPLPGGTDGR